MRDILWPNSRRGLLRNIFILLGLAMIEQQEFEIVLTITFTAFFLTIPFQLLLLGNKNRPSLLDSYISMTYIICLAWLLLVIVVYIGETFFIDEPPPSGFRRIN